jgi:hypothetical protein
MNRGGGDEGFTSLPLRKPSHRACQNADIRVICETLPKLEGLFPNALLNHPIENTELKYPKVDWNAACFCMRYEIIDKATWQTSR